MNNSSEKSSNLKKKIVIAVVSSSVLSALITFFVVFALVRARLHSAPQPDNDGSKQVVAVAAETLPEDKQVEIVKEGRRADIRKSMLAVLKKGGLQEVNMEQLGSPWQDWPSATFAKNKKPAKDQQTQRPDIFLFVVDTARADMTGPGGDTNDTTPFMSSIAASGITFTNAFSPSSWTAPAMFSLITGLYPSEHGITDGVILGNATAVIGQQTLPKEAVTLPERLGSLGYKNFGICTNFHLNSKFGFAQGFDHYVGGDFATLPFPDLAVAAIADRVQKADKSFVWVHYFDPHFPYEQHSPWFEKWNDSGFNSISQMTTDLVLHYYRDREKLGDDAPAHEEHVKTLTEMSRLLSAQHSLLSLGMRYAGAGENTSHTKYLKAAYRSELRATDEAIRKAFDHLKIDEDAIVIITSDHGEEFFDHNWNGHRHTVYQEQLHVPLVIRLPGGAHAGKVINAPVSLVDLSPTLLDLVGEKVPQDLSGRSLVPLIEGHEMSARPIFAESKYLEKNNHTIIEYPWKYILDFNAADGELYNLVDDPDEKNNLHAKQPERAAGMRARLLEWNASNKQRRPKTEISPLGSKELRRLRALGYVK